MDKKEIKRIFEKKYASLEGRLSEHDITKQTFLEGESLIVELCDDFGIDFWSSEEPL